MEFNVGLFRGSLGEAGLRFGWCFYPSRFCGEAPFQSCNILIRHARSVRLFQALIGCYGNLLKLNSWFQPSPFKYATFVCIAIEMLTGLVNVNYMLASFEIPIVWVGLIFLPASTLLPFVVWDRAGAIINNFLSFSGTFILGLFTTVFTLSHSLV